MFLYNLTLESSSHITKGVLGSFSGTAKQQEIVLLKNNTLELLKLLNPVSNPKLTTLLHQQTFAINRSIVPFRLPGGTKDYLVAGADSGKITVLEYNPTKNQFEPILQETFGKSSIRRIVPGQFIAADPKGRAIILCAPEKQKLVYILNRTATSTLTINSPLEANKSNTICFDVTALDVAYENPIFACIEQEYDDTDSEQKEPLEKTLTYYELDLGLNHVVRKWNQVIESTSNMLISIPGGVEGPSGVLVCSEDWITWVHQGFESVKIGIPRRPSSHFGKKGIIIVSSVVHRLKKNNFFILVQTELGDVFKILLDYTPALPDGTGGSGVTGIRIKYFDTIPVAGSICLLKTGFLFVASEFGNHFLYQIENLGDDDPTQIEHTSMTPSDPIEFQPRGLTNLSVIDEIPSLSPLIAAHVANLADVEDTPQIFGLCGRGANSSFRVLRHGLEVNEVACSELPGNPCAVWTVRVNALEEYDTYIIVSFVNATLVLSIGETVEEVTDSGFLLTTPTLIVAQVGEDSLVQVYPHGIRQIRADKRVSEWSCPEGMIIIKAGCNRRQVVIALSNGEIVYFEIDLLGHLNEYHERKEMSCPATCLAIGPIPDGRSRSKFLAVGCEDNTIRIFSLDPTTCLESICMQVLTAIPESITITAMADTQVSGTKNTSSLYLHVGLVNGVLVRCSMDNLMGTLGDVRMRYIGSRPVRLFQIRMMGGDEGGVAAGEYSGVQQKNAVLVLSSKPWIAYVHQGRGKLVPLSYEFLEFGTGFSYEQCPEAIVAVTGNSLKILTLDKLGNMFNQGVIPLSYTPRRLALEPTSRNFVVIESEHGVVCKSEKLKMMDKDSMEQDELPAEQFGLLKADQPGKWVSNIRLLNPFKGDTLSLFELDDNEAAVSLSIVTFTSSPYQTYVVVGCGKDVVLSPRSCSVGVLRVYRFIEEGNALEFLHSTEIEGIPYAIAPFQGRLLVGMGKILRIYELGKKKLLRKCETKQIPHNITQLTSQGNRILISDTQAGVLYAQYIAKENRIIPFADDYIPRWVTCFVMLDYDTIACGDKFGNVFVTRLPNDVSVDVDSESGAQTVYDRSYLNGTPHRVQHLCEFHVGETISSIHRTTLVPGGKQVILYTTILGAIGILIPFASKDDVEFYQSLEMHMRQQGTLFGRDHMSYRGVNVPVKCTVDGDLCEEFNLLTPEKRRAIAGDLDRTSAEVAKKLEDIRNRVAF